MKKAPLLLLGIAGLCAAGTAAACVSASEPRVSLHPLDALDGPHAAARRTWRSPGQVFHHLRELLALSIPLSEVYLARAIDPVFRERIMLVTAMANECTW